MNKWLYCYGIFFNTIYDEIFSSEMVPKVIQNNFESEKFSVFSAASHFSGRYFVWRQYSLIMEIFSLLVRNMYSKW